MCSSDLRFLGSCPLTRYLEYLASIDTSLASGNHCLVQLSTRRWSTGLGSQAPGIDGRSKPRQMSLIQRAGGLRAESSRPELIELWAWAVMLDMEIARRRKHDPFTGDANEAKSTVNGVYEGFSDLLAEASRTSWSSCWNSESSLSCSNTGSTSSF